MKAVITGGGTGGHIYPALAIADRLRMLEPSAEIIYIGDKNNMEAEIVPQAGYDFYGIHTRRFGRGRGLWKDSTEFIKASVGTSYGLSRAFGILGKFKPDIAVGTGGFVSTPVIAAAKMRGAACYIHEQNAVPGMGNKLVQGFCNRIYLGFAGAETQFKDRAKTLYTGNPVRRAFTQTDPADARRILGYGPEEKVVLAIGGSLGSSTINEIAFYLAEKLKEREEFRLIWSTGKKLYESVRTRMQGSALNKNLEVFPFIEDMPLRLAASDLILCRAGALTLAENAACGLPAVIVPYPHAAADHQVRNAREVEQAGAGRMIADDKEKAEEAALTIAELLFDEKRLQAMREAAHGLYPGDAAESICRDLLRDWKEHKKR